MDILIISLRFVHVVGGILWVGGAVFTAFFFAPAIGDAGPEGGKVMVAMQRRGVMTVLPLLALATLISGFWMYWLQFSGAMSSPIAMAFGTGGALALIAFVIGISVAMPAMRRAAALTASLGSTPEAERAARMAEIQRLRNRGAAVTRFVSFILLAAAAAMAVARYV